MQPRHVGRPTRMVITWAYWYKTSYKDHSLDACTYGNAHTCSILVFLRVCSQPPFLLFGQKIGLKGQSLRYLLGEFAPPTTQICRGVGVRLSNVAL